MMVRDQLWVWEVFVNRAIRLLLRNQSRLGLVGVLVHLLSAMILITFFCLLATTAFQFLGLKSDEIVLFFVAPLVLAIAPTFYATFLLIFDYQLYLFGGYYFLGILFGCKNRAIRDSIRRWVQYSE
jgi:hypothetical protein